MRECGSGFVVGVWDAIRRLNKALRSSGAREVLMKARTKFAVFITVVVVLRLNLSYKGVIFRLGLFWPVTSPLQAPQAGI